MVCSAREGQDEPLVATAAASAGILLPRAIGRMTQRRRALPARPELRAGANRPWPIVRAA
jgi:hypothetical protein